MWHLFFGILIFENEQCPLKLISLPALDVEWKILVTILSQASIICDDFLLWMTCWCGISLVMLIVPYFYHWVDFYLYVYPSFIQEKETLYTRWVYRIWGYNSKNPKTKFVSQLVLMFSSRQMWITNVW
jgi:hypothetical protein